MLVYVYIYIIVYIDYDDSPMKEYSAYCRYNPDFVVSYYPRHAFSARKQWIESHGDESLFEVPMKNLLEFSLKQSIAKVNSNPFIKIVNPDFTDEAPPPEKKKKKKFDHVGKYITVKEIKTPKCLHSETLRKNSLEVHRDADFFYELNVYNFIIIK